MPLVSLLHALTRNRARTAPDAPDPRLRTRTYSLAQRDAWNAVLETARAQAGWTVVSADEAKGEIRAEARTPTLGFVDDVTVRVAAGGAQRTRVDVESASRVGRADLGTNARRIARFLHDADRRAARGGQ